MTGCEDCNVSTHETHRCIYRTCGSIDCMEDYGPHAVHECPSIKCRKCKAFGHHAFHCSKAYCGICHQEGHAGPVCIKLRSAMCTTCGLRGHVADHCLGPRKGWCQYCQTTEHSSDRCYNAICDECENYASYEQHTRAYCPERKCSACGAGGHIATVCTDTVALERRKKKQARRRLRRVRRRGLVENDVTTE